MNTDFIRKTEKTVEKVKHIQKLIETIQKDVFNNHLKAVERDLKELTKIVVNLNKEFGLYVSKPSIEKEMDRGFEQVSLELYALCSKISAAIRMGRDDIAINYLQSLTDILSPYFRDWVEPLPVKIKKRKILDIDSDDYIN